MRQIYKCMWIFLNQPWLHFKNWDSVLTKAIAIYGSQIHPSYFLIPLHSNTVGPTLTKSLSSGNFLPIAGATLAQLVERSVFTERSRVQPLQVAPRRKVFPHLLPGPFFGPRIRWGREVNQGFVCWRLPPEAAKSWGNTAPRLLPADNFSLLAPSLPGGALAAQVPHLRRLFFICL